MRERQWARGGSGGRRRSDRSFSSGALFSTDELRVLVVDDNPGVCLMQAIYLRALGCKVFTANDGLGALEQASVLSPDVIVMDMQMPPLDGCEALRRLNELSGTRKIPVIALTEDPNTRLEAFEAGCTVCLMKPCPPQVVWAQICALFRLPDSKASRSAQG